MIKQEQIIEIYPSSIRTLWDHIGFMAFISNYRIVLSDMKSLQSSGILGIFGAIGGAVDAIITKKKYEEKLKQMKSEAKSSLDNLLKANKKNFEIRYDKIIKVEYKHGKKWEPPILTIFYSEPLWKSKDQINLAIGPNLEYRKAKKADGIGEGKSYIEFSKDFLPIAKSIFGEKLFMK